MTPKEKAKQLVDRFRPHAYGLDETERFSPNQERLSAIQCALIAVDEILKEKADCHRYECNGNGTEYWQQVKQEIEKL